MSSSVTINFKDPKAAAHFASWLDGQGEQDYWVWMEYRVEEGNSDIMADRFNYPYENMQKNGKHLIIDTET